MCAQNYIRMFLGSSCHKICMLWLFKSELWVRVKTKRVCSQQAISLCPPAVLFWLIYMRVFPPRLQSGVNLQVCFVNDSSSDKDSDAEDSRTETSLDTPLSPVVCTYRYFPLVLLVSCVITTWENHTVCCIIISVTLLPVQSKQSSSLSDRDTAEEDSDPLDDCGGFWRVQRRLQEEARVALALARPMARMQVEVERQIQLHRRSPVADLVSCRKREQGIFVWSAWTLSYMAVQCKKRFRTITDPFKM